MFFTESPCYYRLHNSLILTFLKNSISLKCG